jgi:hypothetical protein
MANYNAAGRSNYFAVKDEAAFREWALSLGTDAITPDLCRTTADGVRPFGIAVGNHGGSGAWSTVEGRESKRLRGHRPARPPHPEFTKRL